FDDRRRVSAGVKFADAELIGMPLALVVGRGLASGVVELRERASGERAEVPLAEALDAVRAAHERLMGGQR
ncbi:MAG: His/Gly/Thr/Pro-type tRNA ligase C-terminal domain-containing protein, partial [Schaalia hyovaginalis]